MSSKESIESMFSELEFVEIEAVSGGDGGLINAGFGNGAPHYPVPGPVGSGISNPSGNAGGSGAPYPETFPGEGGSMGPGPR